MGYRLAGNETYGFMILTPSNAMARTTAGSTFITADQALAEWSAKYLNGESMEGVPEGLPQKIKSMFGNRKVTKNLYAGA